MLARVVLLSLSVLVLLGVGPEGEKAPTFRTKTIDGEPISSDSLKGKVVLIQFWTTWCGMCRRDEPAVEELIRTVSKDDLVVLAVSVSEDRDTVKKYLEERKRSPKIVLNEDTDLPAKIGVQGFPTYVAISKDGRIGGRQDGAGGFDALRHLIRRAGIW
jgi:thiol-disulfide isomerase/thioredoxin